MIFKKVLFDDFDSILLSRLLKNQPLKTGLVFMNFFLDLSKIKGLKTLKCHNPTGQKSYFLGPENVSKLHQESYCRAEALSLEKTLPRDVCRQYVSWFKEPSFLPMMIGDVEIPPVFL